MRMRGVDGQNSLVVTIATLGAFRWQEGTRHEFMTLVHDGARH